MPSSPFTANVRTQGTAAIIDLQGEINGTADEALSVAYSEAEKSNPPIILLNFSKVDYINSTGIALIVGLLARARTAHRQLLVYGLSDHYQEIFTITRLSDFMSIFPNETAAVQQIENVQQKES
jgi:anti-sigma B factor antagonist